MADKGVVIVIVSRCWVDREIEEIGATFKVGESISSAVAGSLVAYNRAAIVGPGESAKKIAAAAQDQRERLRQRQLPSAPSEHEAPLPVGPGN